MPDGCARVGDTMLLLGEVILLPSFFFFFFYFVSPPFTCIYNFIDSLGQLALQEGVEQFNHHYQAATQHEQGGSQEDQTDLQV